MRTEPRYLQLRAALLERIKSGSYQVGTRIPTEPEIADEFSVSRMTANRAILSLVSDGWLHRKKKSGTFVVDVQSDPLVRLARPVVAIREPERTLEDDYFQGLYWALNAGITAHGGSLLTVPLPETDRVAHLQSFDADPLILFGPQRAFHDDLLEIARNGTRVLLLGTTLQGFGMVAIDSDNLLGPALAISHLAELGHRDIAFFGAYPDDANTVDRLRGYNAAMGARGLLRKQERVVISPEGLLERDRSALEAALRMLSAPDRPSAVFAAGSHLALETVSLARSLNLRVPEDISIVGYDDPPFVSRAIPPLTTVRQPLAEMATFAADLIYSFGATAPRTYNLFDPVLILRGTTASAPPIQ
jgi:DNA-binding LacI/PurR family transcriptional regulator